MGTPTIQGNLSGSPIPLGTLPQEITLDENAIDAFADEPGIRLWHIKADEHDFRCVSSDDGCDLAHNGDGWYRFYGHQCVVDTEAEAQFIEDAALRVYREPVIFRDDLPRPISCLACQVKGKSFSTRCLAMYQAHMFLEHV